MPSEKKKNFYHDGKRYTVYGPDEATLEIKKAMKIRDLEERKVIGSKMLVKDWTEEWLTTYKKGSVSDKTFKDYQSRINNYIVPQIGFLRLKDVRPIHLQQVIQQVNGMSQSYINRVHQCICQIFEAAELNELVPKNPAKGLAKPKGTKGSHRSITPREREVIEKVCQDHKHGLWVMIMMYCGLRPGETARIKMSHFDHGKKLLWVDGTKTHNAQRYVPCPEVILDKIKKIHKGPFDYLFTNQQGRPITDTNRRRMWQSFVKAMHVEMGGRIYNNAIVEPSPVAPDLTPYCLRHTFCTDLQDAGVPINVAKELMGHSDIKLTAQIYTHYTDISMQNAAEKLNMFRSGTPLGTPRIAEMAGKIE